MQPGQMEAVAVGWMNRIQKQLAPHLVESTSGVLKKLLIAVIDGSVRRSTPDLLRDHFRQEPQPAFALLKFDVRSVKFARAFSDSDFELIASLSKIGFALLLWRTHPA